MLAATPGKSGRYVRLLVRLAFPRLLSLGTLRARFRRSQLATSSKALDIYGIVCRVCLLGHNQSKSGRAVTQRRLEDLKRDSRQRLRWRKLVEDGKGKGHNGPQRLRIRRAKRGDYDAVGRLMGAAVADERRRRRRFRRLASSLVEDFYVAERGEMICGMVVVSYARTVDGAITALVRELAVSGPFGDETAEELISLVERRARSRVACRIEVSAAAVGEREDVISRFAAHGYTEYGILLSRSINEGSEG